MSPSSGNLHSSLYRSYILVCTLTLTHTNTHFCTQTCGHCVCLIFSLAPRPNGEHSWHPEAHRGVELGPRNSVTLQSWHLVTNQASPFSSFLAHNEALAPSAPGRRILPWRMTSLRDGPGPLSADSPRTQFPSAASSSGSAPKFPFKNVNWQRT